MNKKAIIEALKEASRTTLIVYVPLSIAYLQTLESLDTIPWKAIIVGIIIFGLRFVDNFIHQLGKEKEGSILIKGLTRF